MTTRPSAQSGRKQQLEELLHQTAEDHHVAYAATDGVDPDWSIWYAGHLLERGIDTLLEARLLADPVACSSAHRTGARGLTPTCTATTPPVRYV